MAERLNYKPIPFVSPPNQRDTGTGAGFSPDARFVNVLFEVNLNEPVKEQSVYCLKRPGLSTFIQPTGASTGRGIYAWSATGSTYGVFGNVIYSHTTSTLAMNTSTGRVWFVETPESTGNRSLIISDGQDNYNITSSNVVTQIDQADNAQYPVSNLGPIVYLDGRLFQGQANSRIQQSNLNSISSWTASTYISADTRGGDLEAIHITKDQIIGLTKNRTEFFFNNGNPTGSILLRIDQNTLGFGIAAKNSLAWSGEIAAFVSENAADGDGTRTVQLLTPGKIKDVSTPTINRFLAAEGTNISSCSAWMERVAGQLIYCLNLATANQSFVYGVDSGLWAPWASGGGRFAGVSATSRDGTVYLQDASSGAIYTLLPNVYTDNDSTFSVTLQTARSNFGSPDFKKEDELWIVGDNTTGNLEVSVSDDDFVTNTTPRNIDMSLMEKKLTRLGGFFARSHRFTYTGSSSLRLQAYVPVISK